MTSATRVRPAWSLLLAALVFASGCDGGSYRLDKFRAARKSRSALALARYLEDDLSHGYENEVIALLDKHFDFALSRVGEHRNAELGAKLLGYLRTGRDPRIAVRIGQPTLDRELSATTTRYFEDSHSWGYAFAEGASLGACEVFDHEVIVFAMPGSMEFDADRAALRVDVEWRVYPSGILFSGPVSFINIAEEAPPIEGVGVEVMLRFEPAAGAARPDREDGPPAQGFTVTGKGVAREGFEYTAFSGLADEDDVYSGMVSAAFADALRQILE